MKEKNKEMNLIILVVGIIVFMAVVFVMSSTNSSGLTDIVVQEKRVNYNGVFGQIHVIISTALVLTNQKRGFIVVCILNAFSLLSGLMGVIHSLNALPGVITPLITVATMFIIYNYLKRSESQRAELKEQYEKIIDSNRIMQEKDEALRMLAYTDRLTGMKNMQYFREQVEEAVRSAIPFAVIHMNIDNFKRINDTFGPKTGDTALIAYAERISKCCGDKYICARSSDEFCIMMTGEQTEADIMNLIEQIRRLLGEKITVQGTNLVVTASYGIVLHPRDGRNAETLLDSAVMAVYTAKARGKNRACFYAQSAGQSVYVNQSVYMPESRYFPG